MTTQATATFMPDATFVKYKMEKNFKRQIYT